MSVTVTALSVDVGVKTVYDIQLTPTVDIPASSVPSSLSTYWGAIDILFPTENGTAQTLWAVDLGTGLNDGDVIPCAYVSGIAPLAGQDNIVCKLTKATGVGSGLSASIRVTGFAAIASGTTCNLQIANIENPVTGGITGDVTVTTYGIQQRVTTDFSTTTDTTIAFYDDADNALPTINGSSPVSFGGDGTNEVTFSPNTVGIGSEMTFVYRPDYTLAASSYLIMKFPSNFELPLIGYTCFVDYSTASTCQTFPDAQWILWTLPSTMQLDAASEYTLTIKGLVNPKDRLDPPAPLDMVAIHASTYYEAEYVKFENIPNLDLGTISPATVTASAYEANRVDVSYTWVFMLANDIPAGGKIVLTFPSGAYVMTTTPTPECSIAGTLF